jgi:predicted RNA-binding protein YlxR (DUF448 family)
MCVGCREEKTKREMLRIVRNASGEDVQIDITGKAPGRGAYVCLNRACIMEAKKTNALSRALRVRIPDLLYAELLSLLEGKEA